MTAPAPQTDSASFRRPPETVMRLARMGSAHPTRLSFLRTLLRRMQTEGWAFDRPVWELVEQWLKARGGVVKARQANVPRLAGAVPNPGYVAEQA